ncbi:hypothetical protein PRIPAC_86789 [Pristionchus pacificus]|uniref:Uncharacterized protein n=1 Tax=Pristionchus pacificus TaxID=54126 RepID=A0A2A6BKG2_PRIPA|nr:hypothetical protein PRIPAC_86789 [Pristionchus pacificus]|eukprot:PDM66377.1 hypothetical protein PRIPAC_47794 [Pristionchus pacificus]
MDDSSDESRSDEETDGTECSSLNSDDDVQISINGDGSESAQLSSPFLSSPLLPSSGSLEPQTVRYVPNRDRNFNHVPAVLDLTGRGNDPATIYASENGESNPGTYQERTVSGGIADHPEPLSSTPSKKKSILQWLKKWFKKAWVRMLLVAIVFIIAGALIASYFHFYVMLRHSSGRPPLLLSEPPQSYQLRNNGVDTSIHVNRTSREIRIARQNSHGALISRYSQAFTFLGNYSYDAREKKWTHLDESVSCCKIRGNGFMCVLKDAKNVRNYTAKANEVLDVETYQSQVRILKLMRTNANIREFEIFDGLKETTLMVNVLDGHSFKSALLQNGTVYSVYENEKSCGHVKCTPVRAPQCNLERVFAARPAHSLVFMHCDPYEAGHSSSHATLHSLSARSDHHPFKQLQCNLSQLLLPTLTTIARSDPFEYTRPYKDDQLIYGFADYTNPNIFHMNQLRLREDMQWEVVISNYQLLDRS